MTIKHATVALPIAAFSFPKRADYIFILADAHHFGLPIACSPTPLRDSL